MKKKYMRWLIDEGIPRVIIDYLETEGHDVFDVTAHLRGSDDYKLWKIAGQENRIILTRDLGFIFPKILSLPAGLVLLRIPDTYSKNTILQLLKDTFKNVSAENFLNNVTVIEPTKIRQRLLSSITGK